MENKETLVIVLVAVLVAVGQRKFAPRQYTSYWLWPCDFLHQFSMFAEYPPQNGKTRLLPQFWNLMRRKAVSLKKKHRFFWHMDGRFW